jgi:hypothetical protein
MIATCSLSALGSRPSSLEDVPEPNRTWATRFSTALSSRRLDAEVQIVRWKSRSRSL